MVTKRELKRVLVKEKVKAIYNSIDTKELKKLEQKEREYQEYIKKDYHPISYQIDKEVEEEWDNNPLQQELWDIESYILTLYFIYLGGWFLAGIFVIWYSFMSY